MRFVTGTNDEHFTGDEYDTREAAVAGALDEFSLDPGETYYTGQVEPVGAEEYVTAIDAESLLERMGEAAYEDVGDPADDWLRYVPAEQARELTDAVRAAVLAWVARHGHGPTFFRVVDVESHTVPEAAEAL